MVVLLLLKLVIVVLTVLGDDLAFGAGVGEFDAFLVAASVACSMLLLLFVLPFVCC